MAIQVLKSGLIVQQDYARAVRAVFFDTGIKEYQYATHGGTAFLARVADQVFAVTCRHVIDDFDTNHIFITQERFGEKGSKPAPVSELIYPSKPVGFAQESDVMDLCAIRLSSEMPADFFHDPPYVMDEGTVASSEPGDQLEVFGVLNSKSAIISPDLIFSFGRLQFQNFGHCDFDPVLCEARAKFAKPEFETVDGISGAPVFNLSKNALCGMVVRGGMTGTECQIYYLDVAHIRQLLLHAVERKKRANYVETAIVRKEGPSQG